MKGKQIYWDDVKVGQEIPGFSIDIGWTLIVKQVSGTQDFYPVHHDPDFARAGGHRDIFVNTGFMQSCFSRLMTDWIGDEGSVRKFHMEMRKMNMPGDTVTFKGKVTNKSVQVGEHCVDADIWCENQRDGVTTPSRCTVILPTKR